VDERVGLWEVGRGGGVGVLRGHTERVWGVCFDPGGKRLASASGDGTARLWDVAGGGALLTLAGHLNAGARGCAFSPDGKRLVSVGFDHTVKVWDAASGENPLTLRGAAVGQGRPAAGLGVG